MVIVLDENISKWKLFCGAQWVVLVSFHPTFGAQANNPNVGLLHSIVRIVLPRLSSIAASKEAEDACVLGKKAITHKASSGGPLRSGSY